MKWLIGFGLLSLWTLIVVGTSFYDLKAGDLLPSAQAAEERLTVYYEGLGSSLALRAGSGEIKDYLFDQEFEVFRGNYVVMDTCSLRAKDGKASIGGNDYGSVNNDASLSFLLPNGVDGQGSVTMQKGRSRAQFKFDVLSARKEGGSLAFGIKGRYKEGLLFWHSVSGTAFLDLSTKKVSFYAGDLVVEDMAAWFLSGCAPAPKPVFLMKQVGELDSQRPIGEVRDLLDENPEFVRNYNGLRKLYTPTWWMVLPPTTVS